MTLFGALGAYFFKKVTADGIWNLITDKHLYLGGGFYVLGALINILLLRTLNYSIIYPMSCLTYIWTTVLSKCMLNEKITRKKAAGIAFLVLGVVILTISGNE